MSRSKLLLLDEPSMGLAPLMVQKIFTTIAEIAASGELTLSDSAPALAANPEVRRAYLGE